MTPSRWSLAVLLLVALPLLLLVGRGRRAPPDPGEGALRSVSPEPGEPPVALGGHAATDAGPAETTPAVPDTAPVPAKARRRLLFLAEEMKRYHPIALTLDEYDLEENGEAETVCDLFAEYTSEDPRDGWATILWSWYDEGERRWKPTFGSRAARNDETGRLEIDAGIDPREFTGNTHMRVTVRIWRSKTAAEAEEEPTGVVTREFRIP